MTASDRIAAKDGAQASCGLRIRCYLSEFICGIAQVLPKSGQIIMSSITFGTIVSLLAGGKFQCGCKTVPAAKGTILKNTFEETSG